MGNNNAYDKFSRNNFKNTIKNNNNRINFPRNIPNYQYQNNEYQEEPPTEELTKTEETTKTIGRTAANIYGGKLGTIAYDTVSNTKIGEKLTKQTTKKLKLYLYIGIATALLFIILAIFMVLFIDNTMSNILNFTNWNFGSTSTENEVIDSNTNFSSNESETIKENTLTSLIGEEGITKLETQITETIISTCTGKNVAQIAVKLIDGLNEYGYRVPYSTYNKTTNQIIDPNWGGTFTETVDNTENTYTYGFNDYTFLAWTFTNAKISKTPQLNELINIGTTTSSTSTVPGDILTKDDKTLLVIQNVGTSITVAEVTEEGLKYSEYKTSELTQYAAISMNNYYTNNCSIWNITSYII